MSEHKINSFIGVSIEKIRSMVDSDTMIGSPVNCKDGTTIIPVSKVSVGFASGGSDLPTRTSKEYFAGGAGAGMSVKPVGFLVVKNGEVKMIPMEASTNGAVAIMDKVPELLSKLMEMFKKDKDKDPEEEVTDAEIVTDEKDE